ncbi:hypothetical protein LQV05_001189 [Cryptococcus neoformans]|nr:hypothetical protein LQV05_001189 [Cryptococcus neoformans]
MPRSSNPRASSSSGNPYGRTNDVIEAASIGQKTTLPQIAVLNHRISLEFSEADNQPLSSSSRADDVAAPTLPSVPLSDDSVSSDISIPRSSPPAGQFMSLSDDAYPPPLSGQETSQGGLEREFMDINNGQGYDDLPAIMMDEYLLETGFEGDGYGGVIRDRLSHQLSKWPTKVPESLIPSYSCRQPSPYQDEPIFSTESTARSMPLLATVLAVFSIFLMAFVGLPQRLGDMVKAVIQVILEFAIAEDQQALRWRIYDKRDLSPGEREKMYRILDLSVETSSSRLRKNVKTLYGQLDLDPSVAVHPKCPTRGVRMLWHYSAGERKAGDSFFPRRILQAKLEYLFSLDNVERLVEDQQVLRSRQRQRDEQMERPTYLRDANPGKILHHQLDGSCCKVDDHDVQRERGCLILTINVSFDWTDPSKSCNRSSRSMGPIIVS